MSTLRWLKWLPKAPLEDKTGDPEPPKPPKILSGGFGGAVSGLLPIIEPDAAAIVKVPLRDRDEERRRRDRLEPCNIHHARARGRSRVDGSQVCGMCHPDPYLVAVEKTMQSGPLPMPKGVRLLLWAPVRPPVVIERWAVVNDALQFIQKTLGQLQVAMAGEHWLAGNWSVRELVDRLEQVGVRVSLERIQNEHE